MSTKMVGFLRLLFAPMAVFMDWKSWADDRESRARVWSYPLALLAFAATMLPFFTLILWAYGLASMASLGEALGCFVIYGAVMNLGMWWVDAFCSPIASSPED